MNPPQEAPQPHNVYSIQNNYNIVPHKDDELERAREHDAEYVGEAEAGPDDVVPDLHEEESDSDNETYETDAEESEIELDDEFIDEDKALEDAPENLIIREDELGYLGIIMMQLNLKEGLKIWGEKGEKSAMKEMAQLHDMDTFVPRDPKSLTREERIKALSLLIFLKEKANGDKKSRTCVNGAPQQAYIKKEDAASPTVMTDSVFITGAIDAYEQRVTPPHVT
ncbi:hypothetical protein ACHAWX_000477 [Stephanocyclus meneghinianus]